MNNYLLKFLKNKFDLVESFENQNFDSIHPSNLNFSFYVKNKNKNADVINIILENKIFKIQQQQYKYLEYELNGY